MDNGKSKIQDIITNRISGVKSKDVYKATQDYSDDVILYDIVDPLERHGIQSVKDRLEQWLATLAEIKNFEIRNIEISTSETIAYCTSLNHIDAINTKGAKLDMWWRETTCYSKINGTWKITHAHSSVPFNPDNGKPSLALKPDRII
jgi:ketosteroid isomerase-like protein